MTLGLSPEELRVRQRVQIKQWRDDHPVLVRAYNLAYERKTETKLRRAQWHAANQHRRAARRLVLRNARDEAAEYMSLTAPERAERAQQALQAQQEEERLLEQEHQVRVVEQERQELGS
jgi:hypothetical protein